MTATNFDALELDYRMGFLPPAAICAKHMISKKELYSIVNRHDWKRSPKGNVVVPIVQYPFDLDDIQKTYVEQGTVQATAKYDLPLHVLARIAQEDGWEQSASQPPDYEITPEFTPAPGPRAVSLFSAEDVERAQVIATAAVLTTHRQQESQLRRLMQKTMNALEDIADGKIPTFDPIGDMTYIDAVGKVIIQHGALQTAERKTYAMDVAGRDEAQNKELDAYTRMNAEDRKRKIDQLLQRAKPVQLPGPGAA